MNEHQTPNFGFQLKRVEASDLPRLVENDEAVRWLWVQDSISSIITWDQQVIGANELKPLWEWTQHLEKRHPNHVPLSQWLWFCLGCQPLLFVECYPLPTPPPGQGTATFNMVGRLETSAAHNGVVMHWVGSLFRISYYWVSLHFHIWLLTVRVGLYTWSYASKHTSKVFRIKTRKGHSHSGV